MDDNLGGKAVQVRVTQGKEPAHFRLIFPLIFLLITPYLCLIFPAQLRLIFPLIFGLISPFF